MLKPLANVAAKGAQVDSGYSAEVPSAVGVTETIIVNPGTASAVSL